MHPRRATPAAAADAPGRRPTPPRRPAAGAIKAPTIDAQGFLAPDRQGAPPPKEASRTGSLAAWVSRRWPRPLAARLPLALPAAHARPRPHPPPPQVAQAIYDAGAEYGCFQLVNHGVSLDLIAAMKAQQRAFFALPLEAKAAGAGEGGEGFRAAQAAEKGSMRARRGWPRSGMQSPGSPSDADRLPAAPPTAVCPCLPPAVQRTAANPNGWANNELTKRVSGDQNAQTHWPAPGAAHACSAPPLSGGPPPAGSSWAPPRLAAP